MHMDTTTTHTTTTSTTTFIDLSQVEQTFVKTSFKYLYNVTLSLFFTLSL